LLLDFYADQPELERGHRQLSLWLMCAGSRSCLCGIALLSKLPSSVAALFFPIL
jgi:hypothetical protein